VDVCGIKWEGVERRSSRRSPVKNEIEHMFLGQYQHTLDSKYRLIIPARFRELLADGAYIIQGMDQNLMVMTSKTFELINERINAESITDSKVRLLRRLLFSNGERVDVDSAGRILLPPFLRQAAGLDSEVVIVGAGNYFEIWSPERWNEQLTLIQDTQANEQRFAEFDIPIG
jgi:MraZ protein